MGDIPLLKESVAYAARLATAAQRFGESRYATHRRINWSHRYAQAFSASETMRFVVDSQAYLAGRALPPEPLEDVYRQRLAWPALAAFAAKIAAHGMFALLGALQAGFLGAPAARIYRKCYVDDIELVFDPDAPDTMRAVYPFPLSVRRQWKYLKRLRREGHGFRFAGHPYHFGDILRLVRRRDLRAMMRLESRAQLTHAMRLAERGYRKVEMSDEFNLGSLEFARALARCGVETVNSAHGVGKYLPVHAYQSFLILTRLQKDYYIAVRPCRYEQRRLNDVAPPQGRVEPIEGAKVRAVLLSQTFPGLTGVVRDREAEIIARLVREFARHPSIELLFKPHPTQGERPAPAGFALLHSLAQVNGMAGTVFVSQFSTCQIDPTFKGRKLLVRGPLVHPEIAFDAEEPILTVDELVVAIRSMAEGTSPTKLEPIAYAG